MGLYDDIIQEVEGQQTNTPTSSGVGLFDDIKAEVENAPQEPSFMDNVKDFGGKVLNKGRSVISNLNTSNPYDNSLLKGGIETNVFQPNQYGVTPLQGVGNIVSDIGSGVKQFAKAPFEFAKQLGKDTITTGKNIVNNPALISDIPLAVRTGLTDLPFNVAQAVVDLPETIASSYNNRPFERQVNVPNSDEFAESLVNTLTNLVVADKLKNAQLHQKRLQEIAEQRERLNQLPIAHTVGAFMLPASQVANVAKTKGVLDSVKTGAKWGLATTSGSVEDRTVGTLGGGAFGGTLHAGIKTVPKIAKGVKNVSAEIVDRLNPENYEQVINSKPVKKGMGLSQRTVYEPELKYEYKPKRDTYNMKEALGKERVTQKGTDFTMGESGELKTPERPVKKKYGVSTNVQYTPNFTIEKVAPSVFAKQQAKEEAKQQAHKEQIENLAPNTMAEQKAKDEIKEAQKQTQKRGYHTKDFNKGDIVRDIYSGHIYEVIEPDKRGMGKLRDVDTNEIRTPNADNNAHYEKYEYNPDDLIEVEEFKYNPKENKRANSDLKTQQDYMYSKQEVVDAYNEYIKKPTEANKEKYEDVSGKALKEFHDNKEAILNGTFNQRVENTEKVNTNEVADTSGNTEAEIERVAKEYATMLGHSDIDDFHRKFAKALVNKDAEFIKDLIGHGKGFNDNSKKMFAKYAGIELPTTIKGKKEVVDKWANGESLDSYKKQTFDNDKPTMKFSYNSKNKEDFYYNKIYLLTDKEGNITHFTDGRAVYKSDYVNADYSKYPESHIIKTDSNMQTQQVIEDYLRKTKDNEYLLKDIGKEFKQNKLTGRVFELDNDGKKMTVYVDKKYLLDGKGIELYTSSKENPLVPLKITKNGEYIGLVMPVDIKTEPVTKDVKPFLKKDTKKQAKPLEKSEKIVNNDSTVPINEVTKNEYVRPNGISERSEKQGQTEERIDTGRNKVTESDIGVRREDKLHNGRRITDEHNARISKSFKNQHELNRDIEDFINNKEYEVYNGDLPQEIKDYLKKYAGAGGLEKQGAEGKGLLSEYYTPDNIVKKMWDLTSQYINTDGSKVLEPSVGIGRFLEHAPKGTSFDVVEMNPVSAKITELLYPDANVRVGQFQERFIDNNKNVPIKNVEPEYDIVIGNPPYGEYSGRYKGLGEGKKYKTLQAYFINRGLDTLKENGVMTFIVPSSFLDNISDKIEISNKAEILDAYRLPENTFDTTSIGTDIIVMRKRTGQGQDLNFISKEWFKKHPEKILGTVETRKNKYGKEETFVKGDKNAVDNIDTSKQDIKETETVIEKHPETPKKQKTTRKSAKKNEENTIKGKVEYNEYQHQNSIPAEDMKYYTDTQVDGTLPREKYSPNEKVNQYNGELYNDINYLQGDIYEKLDALEYENISNEQKAIQRKKLEKVLPTPKTTDEILLNPTSDFIREYKTGIVKDEEEWGVYDGRYLSKVVQKDQTLDKLYKEYAKNLSAQERDNVPYWTIQEYVDGKEIRIDYKYSKYTLSESEKKKERLAQRGRELAKIKRIVDKTFNDFVKSELTQEQREQLADAWNRNFNNQYTPDYKQMPMLVKGLRDTFYDNKLKLYDVQVEGINFLTNKGVGLLGFEVGVGKTLSGIISTVQNMQMGRCKKPLILVPNQVKDNWIREINETFPNIKVNDVGNMSKFSGEIENNTITIATYEALGNIWYGKDVAENLIKDIYDVGKKRKDKNNRDSTERAKEKVKERAEKMLGNAEKGNKKLHTLEDLGFDHITVDEAHNFKNLFGDARADGKDGNTYVNITGGAESARASRLFLLAQQILKNNGNRNVFMLTATPFNNSPLEVFNMLSFIAKDKLDKMGLYNVYQFMENYADMTSDWVVDSKNEVIEKQIVTGFKNAQSLREVIKSAMMIRSADDAGIKRPEKHTKRVVLEPSQKQLDLIAEAEKEAVESNEKDSGAVLKALTKSRLATLSPDIAKNNLEVSPEDFVNNSPKLAYICKAVESLHKSDSNASQIIYMPLGVKFLPKLQEYLISKGIFKKGEVEIISGEVSEDKRNKIVESFNDRDGKVKLVIGTSKIREGMNLNKNSAVLYVPFMDWNPTDFVQVVGRIWRQGNSYDKVRVVVPLLKNSSDSFMFQKLSEKTDRINNIMDGDKDYIDTNELNTAEEKLNMISDPEKKSRMFTRVEKQKLETEKNTLQGRLETVNTYKSNLARFEKDIEGYKTTIKTYQDKLQGLDKEDYHYEYYQKYIKDYKKELKEAEAKLERLKRRIAQLELDFEGKDAPETIEKLIEAKQKEIDEVEELAKKKLVEYQKDYEKERATSKTIDDHIKDFENDTKELYGDNGLADIDISEFMKNKSVNNFDYGRDIDLTPIYNSISKGIKGKDLAKLLPDKIADIILDGAENYTFVEHITDNKKDRGFHSGKKSIIKLNLEAIGNSPYRFIEVLTHEVEHANQHKLYLNIMAKPKNTWTPEERIYVANYNNSKRVNKEREKYYNKHKDLIDKFRKDNFYSKEERTNAIFQLKDKERNIVLEYDKHFENYWNSFNEVKARAEGTKNAKGYRKESRISRLPKTERVNTRLTKKRYLGSDSRNSTTEGEYSTEQPEYKQVKNSARQDEINIEKATRDSLYKWYGEVEKARFDVDKDLNQFNQITKSTAKDFSNKTGLKVSDKMIREILPFLRERTEVPEALGRKDLTKFYNKLSQADIIRLTKLADDVCAKFDKYWQNYKDAKGILTDEDIENHISHLWKTDKKQKSVLTNYFNTNSRFAKPRTIESLVRGIEMGYEPRTLDIGEILKIQSDSLIKSANDSILANKLKKMKYDGEILLQPSSKAPADWVEINHPALNKAVYSGSTDNGIILSKQPVKVHPAVADIIAPVFEVQKADNGLWKVYDNVNGTLKQAQLGFSGFHGYALTESSIGNSYLKNTLKHLNPVKLVDAIRNGNYDIFEREEIAKDGIEHGLKLGTPSDLNRRSVEKFLSNIPFIGKLTEINNKILWDCLHNSFKIEAYKMKCDEVGKDITDEQKRSIAQWVNDSFGGQAWELLGVKNSTIKGLSRALLSPDWLISTTRQFMGMAENTPISKWLKNSNIKALKNFAKLSGVSDIGNSIGVRGKSAVKFWATAMVYSVLFYNLINAMFRYKDRKDHPELYPDNSLMSYTIWDNALPADKWSTKIMPYIFIGRNKDGSARYLRLGKQFREVPEMMSEPVQKLSMKSATVPSAIANVGLGYSLGDVPKKLAGKDNDVYYNQEIWNGYGKFAKKKQGLELAKGMGKTALKSTAPFVVNNALNDKHNFSAWDMFAQTSNGLGYTKAKKQYLYAYEHGNKPKDFEKITKKGIQDGMSYKKLRTAQKSAKNEYTQDLIDKYSTQYVNALKKQDQNKINNIADELEKENVPANIRVKVYKSALKEYRKSMK